MASCPDRRGHRPCPGAGVPSSWPSTRSTWPTASRPHQDGLSERESSSRSTAATCARAGQRQDRAGIDDLLETILLTRTPPWSQGQPDRRPWAHRGGGARPGRDPCQRAHQTAPAPGDASCGQHVWSRRASRTAPASASASPGRPRRWSSGLADVPRPATSCASWRARRSHAFSWRSASRDGQQVEPPAMPPGGPLRRCRPARQGAAHRPQVGRAGLLGAWCMPRAGPDRRGALNFLLQGTATSRQRRQPGGRSDAVVVASTCAWPARRRLPSLRRGDPLYDIIYKLTEDMEAALAACSSRRSWRRSRPGEVRQVFRVGRVSHRRQLRHGRRIVPAVPVYRNGQLIAPIASAPFDASRTTCARSRPATSAASP